MAGGQAIEQRDLAARQRYISRSGWWAIPGTVAAAAVACVALPAPAMTISVSLLVTALVLLVQDRLH